MTATKQVSTIDQQLRFAIANTRLIEFSYHGIRRVAEPHDYGIQNGTIKLLVYQRTRAGGSDPRDDSVQGWRLLEVDKMTECSVVEATFSGSRGAAHHRHHAWDVVYARVR